MPFFTLLFPRAYLLGRGVDIMPALNIKNNTSLVIRFTKGQNVDGSPKAVSQKFSNVSTTATDDQILAIGTVIGKVLISDPIEIKKVEDFSLSEG